MSFVDRSGWGFVVDVGLGWCVGFVVGIVLEVGLGFIFVCFVGVRRFVV